MTNIENIWRTILVSLRARLTKKCTNLDLRFLDFSHISPKLFENVTFEHSNLSGSKIYLNPKKLDLGDPPVLQNIVLEDVDLSYLTERDFESVLIRNCNLKNTGLHLDFNRMINPSETMYSVILDPGIILSPFTKVNLDTINLNPDYPFTDFQIVDAVVHSFDCSTFHAIRKDKRNHRSYPFGLSKNQFYQQMNRYLDLIISTLRSNQRDKMVHLIEKLRETCELDDIFNLFTYQNFETHIQNTDFTAEDVQALSGLILKNYLNFDSCTFDVSYKRAVELGKNEDIGIFNAFTTFSNCSFNEMVYSNEKNKRIEDTPFTCNTSAYVKLGNACNGTCSFCKNITEKISPTCIDKVLETLTREDLLHHLNQIYFGGGEPTLYLNEIENILFNYWQILSEHAIEVPDFYLFTNGSGDWERVYHILSKYRQIYFHSKIMLSRHEIEDEKNQKILGVRYSLEDPYFQKLVEYRKVILALTCSELNMREHFLEEYLQFGRELGVRSFMIQNLEAKTDIPCDFIGDYLNIFESNLEKEHFKKSSIVSTSYFDLSLLSDGVTTVWLKRYFDPSELEAHFKHNSKHSFDLGIDSNGDLYNDFQMIKRIK